eukprot:scaffold98773_cov72-Phaeocystis_antarctica.AAC.2
MYTTSIPYASLPHVSDALSADEVRLSLLVSLLVQPLHELLVDFIVDGQRAGAHDSEEEEDGCVQRGLLEVVRVALDVAQREALQPRRGQVEVDGGEHAAEERQGGWSGEQPDGQEEAAEELDVVVQRCPHRQRARRAGQEAKVRRQHVRDETVEAWRVAARGGWRRWWSWRGKVWSRVKVRVRGVVARAGAGTGAVGEPSPPVPKLAGPRPPSEPWWIMRTPARTRIGTSTLAASPSSSLEVRKTVPGPPSSWLGGSGLGSVGRCGVSVVARAHVWRQGLLRRTQSTNCSTSSSVAI